MPIPTPEDGQLMYDEVMHKKNINSGWIHFVILKSFVLMTDSLERLKIILA